MVSTARPFHSSMIGRFSDSHLHKKFIYCELDISGKRHDFYFTYISRMLLWYAIFVPYLEIWVLRLRIRPSRGVYKQCGINNSAHFWWHNDVNLFCDPFQASELHPDVQYSHLHSTGMKFGKTIRILVTPVAIRITKYFHVNVFQQTSIKCWLKAFRKFRTKTCPKGRIRHTNACN